MQPPHRRIGRTATMATILDIAATCMGLALFAFPMGVMGYCLWLAATEAR